MSPFALRLTTALLAAITLGFALLQLFSAGLALRQHQTGTAVFYALLGLAGCAIAQALWRARSKLR